jgi:hypothetical protein
MKRQDNNIKKLKLYLKRVEKNNKTKNGNN